MERLRRAGALFFREAGAAPGSISMSPEAWQDCVGFAAANNPAFRIEERSGRRAALQVAMFGRFVDLECDLAVTGLESFCVESAS